MNSTCGPAHLCTAVVVCGSQRVAPSKCLHGPAGGTAGFSVRCAADFPGSRLLMPWLIMSGHTPALQPPDRDKREQVRQMRQTSDYVL